LGFDRLSLFGHNNQAPMTSPYPQHYPQASQAYPPNPGYGQGRNQNLVENQPRFAGPPPNYPPQQFPQQPANPAKPPKKKGRWKGVFILLFIFILLGGGAAGYLFFDWNQQSKVSQAINNSVNTNYQIYTNLTESTKETFKTLENQNYTLEDEETVTLSALENMDEQLATNTTTLEELISDHTEALQQLEEEPIQETQEYKKAVEQALQKSQNQVQEIHDNYQSFRCINEYVIQFNELTEKIVQTSEEFRKNSQNDQPEVVIQATDNLISSVNAYAATLEEFKTCFAAETDLYDTQKATSSIENTRQLYLELAEGLTEYKTALQEENTDEAARAQDKVNATIARSSEIGFSEDYYAVFDQEIQTKFEVYYNFVSEQKDSADSNSLKYKKEELNRQYEIRESFLPF
jgi:hypothetical protein